MFSVNSYLKVWDIKKTEEKYLDAQCSTSRKVADGQYETDFSGFVRFVGHAFNQVKGCQKGDSFQIKSCGVTTQYSKEKNTTYTNFVVFEVESGNQKPKQDEFMKIPDDADEELPFN